MDSSKISRPNGFMTPQVISYLYFSELGGGRLGDWGSYWIRTFLGLTGKNNNENLEASSISKIHQENDSLEVRKSREGRKTMSDG